jgi:hypothetical protein
LAVARPPTAFGHALLVASFGGEQRLDGDLTTLDIDRVELQRKAERAEIGLDRREARLGD